MSKIFRVTNGVIDQYLSQFNSLADVTETYQGDNISVIECPDNAAVDIGYMLNDAGEIVKSDDYDARLAAAKTEKQNKNKKAFETFLKDHPLYYTPKAKYYGITLEDQQEIALNLTQYNLSVEAGLTPTLEWHAVGSACETWTGAELMALTLAIKEAVYEWFQLFNEYKASIYSATTFTALDAISIVYQTDEEAAAAENTNGAGGQA